jgi:hypothetical protein
VINHETILGLMAVSSLLSSAALAVFLKDIQPPKGGMVRVGGGR